MPDRLRCDSISPYLFEPVDAPKNRPVTNGGHVDPLINGTLRPCRYRHGSNVLPLANQVSDDPVLFPELEILPFQPDKFSSPESTADQQGHDRPITLAPDSICWKPSQKLFGLFDGQPITDPHAEALRAFHTVNAGRKLWTQQSCVGDLIR